MLWTVEALVPFAKRHLTETCTQRKLKAHTVCSFSNVHSSLSHFGSVLLFNVIFSIIILYYSCIMYFVKFKVHERVCEGYMSETEPSYFNHTGMYMQYHVFH